MMRVSDNLIVLPPADQVTAAPGCVVGALRAAGATVLIDAGLERNAATILRTLDQLGWPGPPKILFLTHAHGDHASGAVGLHRRHGTRILSHPGVVAILAAAPAQETDDPWTLASCPVEPIADGQRFTFGEATITAYSTPGHTADGVAYLVEVDGVRCVFSGDLVMSNMEPGWRGDPKFSIEDTVRSLERLMPLGAERMFTGHSAIEGNPAEFLAKTIAAGRSGAWSK